MNGWLWIPPGLTPIKNSQPNQRKLIRNKTEWGQVGEKLAEKAENYLILDSGITRLSQWAYRKCQETWSKNNSVVSENGKQNYYSLDKK